MLDTPSRASIHVFSFSFVQFKNNTILAVSRLVLRLQDYIDDHLQLEGIYSDKLDAGSVNIQVKTSGCGVKDKGDPTFVKTGVYDKSRVIIEEIY